MCGCPSAAATRPQPRGLKQAQVVFLQLRRLESLNQGHGTKTKVWVGWLLLEAPRPNSLVSDLSRLPEAPTFLGSGPSLHSQPLCFHRLPAPTLIPCPPPETPGMTLGPSEKSPLPCNVTCSQVPGNRVWTSFGVIRLPTTCRLPPRGRGSGFTARRWGGQAHMASNPHSQPSPWRLQPTPWPLRDPHGGRSAGSGVRPRRSSASLSLTCKMGVVSPTLSYSGDERSSSHLTLDNRVSRLLGGELRGVWPGPEGCRPGGGLPPLSSHPQKPTMPSPSGT